MTPEKKIRVLQIIKSLGRGGAEMLLVETLKEHDQSVFEFHYIYFLPWKDQLVADLKNAGGRVTCIAAKNNIQLALRTRSVIKYIRENRIDVIHSHLPWAGVVAKIAGKFTSVPVIYTEHNKQERYHFATRFLNLQTMNWLQSVVPVSQDVEESLRKFKPGLKANVKTILNGVNVDRFRPHQDASVRQQLNISNKAVVISTIAVFRFQKRLALWLELAAEILKERPQTFFIIIGDGPLKQLVLDKLNQLGIEKHVHLAGLQTEVRPYLAASDIYMMTSIFEGLPIALLEAMASGLPVISTNAGGIKEVIRHEQDGLVCDVNEPSKLKSFAVQLIDQPQQRLLLGKNARLRIEQSFSMKSMVSQLEQLYRSLLRKP